jgi:hypothetical protein
VTSGAASVKDKGHNPQTQEQATQHQNFGFQNHRAMLVQKHDSLMNQKHIAFKIRSKELTPPVTKLPYFPVTVLCWLQCYAQSRQPPPHSCKTEPF